MLVWFLWNIFYQPSIGWQARQYIHVGANCESVEDYVELSDRKGRVDRAAHNGCGTTADYTDYQKSNRNGQQKRTGTVPALTLACSETPKKTLPIPVVQI